jgi:hypothetical protein
MSNSKDRVADVVDTMSEAQMRSALNFLISYVGSQHVFKALQYAIEEIPLTDPQS